MAEFIQNTQGATNEKDKNDHSVGMETFADIIARENVNVPTSYTGYRRLDGVRYHCLRCANDGSTRHYNVCEWCYGIRSAKPFAEKHPLKLFPARKHSVLKAKGPIPPKNKGSTRFGAVSAHLEGKKRLQSISRATRKARRLIKENSYPSEATSVLLALRGDKEGLLRAGASLPLVETTGEKDHHDSFKIYKGMHALVKKIVKGDKFADTSYVTALISKSSAGVRGELSNLLLEVLPLNNFEAANREKLAEALGVNTTDWLDYADGFKPQGFSDYLVSPSIPFKVGLDKDTKELTTDILAAVEDVAETIKGVSDRHSIDLNHKVVLPELMSHVKDGLYASYIFLCSSMSRLSNLDVIADLVIALISTTGVIADYVLEAIKKTFSWVARLSSREADVVSQGSEEELGGIISSMFVWLPWSIDSGLGKAFSGSRLKESVKKVLDELSNIKKHHSSITFCLQLGKSVLQTVMGLLGCEDILRGLMTYPILLDIKAFTDDLENKLSTGQYVVTENDALQVREFRSRLRENIETAGSRSPDLVGLKDAARRLSKLHQLTEVVFAQLKKRIQPVVVMMTGSPGVGKTTVMVAIQQALLAASAVSIEELNKIDPEDPLSKGVWHCNTNSNFADGLKPGVDIVSLDEFMGKKDTGSGPDESVVGFIGMANTTPYIPLMAVAEQKGHMHFNPKYITGTTNALKMGPEQMRSVTDPKAITRRFDFPLIAECKPEFWISDTNRKVDPAKVAAANAVRPEGDPLVNPTKLMRWDYNLGKIDDTNPEVFEPIELAAAMIELRKVRLEYARNTKAASRDLFDHFKRLRLAELMEPVVEQGFDAAIIPKKKILEEEGDSKEEPLTEEEMEAEGAKFVTRHMNNMLSRSMDFEWPSILKPIIDNLPSKFAIAAALTAFTGALLIARNFAAKSFSYQSAVTVLKNAPRRISRIKRGVKAKVVLPQAGEADNNVMIKVINNRFELHLGKLGANNRVMSTNRECMTTCLGDSTFFLPAHTYHTIKDKYQSGEHEDTMVEFRKPNCKGGGVTCTLYDFLTYVVVEETPHKPHEDKCYVRLPKNALPACKRITQLVIRNYRGGDCVWVTDRNGEIDAVAVKTTLTGVDYNGFKNASTVYYDLDTRAGDCGSLLFGKDASGQLGLVGFHVAGRNGHGSLGGFAQTFSSDLDDIAMDGIGEGREIKIPDCIKSRIKFLSPVHQAVGNMEKIAVVKTPRTNPKSKIILAPLASVYHEGLGLEPVKMKPFKNKSGEFVVPENNARMRYSKTAFVIDEDELKATEHAVLKRIMRDSTSCVASRISTHEAMAGPGNVRMMNRRSNIGYVETILYGSKDKTSIMGTEGEVDTSAPMYKQFVKDCDEYERKVLLGTPDKVSTVADTDIFSDFLKDELKSSAKVQAGADRKVSGSGALATVMARKAYHNVMSVVVDPKNMIRNGSALGINPATQWNALASHLLGFGTGILASDFKSWDGSLSYQLMQTGFNIMDKICPTNDDEIKTLRHWVRNQTCNSVHIDGPHLLVWTGSNPSGGAFTTVLNNIIQALAFHLIISRHVCTSQRDLVSLPPLLDRSHFKCLEEGLWEDQLRNTDFKIASRISDLYQLVTFGDDGIMSVSEELRLTTKDLAINAKSFGFSLTNEDKTDPMMNPREPGELQSCTFLKRGFSYVEGIWQCPLDKKSIYKSMSFVKEKFDMADYERTLYNAALEFSMHDKETFDYERIRLLKATSARGLSVTIPEYEDCRTEFLGSEILTWVG